jgi:hypothetical protein
MNLRTTYPYLISGTQPDYRIADLPLASLSQLRHSPASGPLSAQFTALQQGIRSEPSGLMKPSGSVCGLAETIQSR